jgi:hypothetical protein
MTLGNDLAHKTVYEPNASSTAAQCAVCPSRGGHVTE